MEASPFDQEAEYYDENFTHTSIGRFQRARVYYWLKKSKLIPGHSSVFEMNCGTGYDAEQFAKQGLKVWATDGSEQMIRYAKNNRSEAIDFYPLKFQDVSQDSSIANAELLFSNFGGLNCLSPDELKQFIHDIALKQTKGNQVALVIMPKHCWMEDLYFTIIGKAKNKGRRNSNNGLEVNLNGEKVKTYFHSPLALKKYLQKDYNILMLKPIAFFLPPSYLQSFFNRNPILLKILYQFEKLFGRFEVMSAWSDHFIVIAERK